MKTKYVVIGLVILLIFLQYKLWFEQSGVRGYINLKEEIAEQTQENQQLDEKNQALEKQITNLKQGHAKLEEDARNELGMIKQGETFYQVTK